MGIAMHPTDLYKATSLQVILFGILSFLILLYQPKGT